jgi:two-component sensor histidine kinase
MKKTFLFLVMTACFIQAAQAQIAWVNYSQSYPSQALDQATNIGIIVAIPEINNWFWRDHPNKILHAKLANDQSFQQNRPKDFVSINSFDTAKAQFFLHGINKINAKNYEFRVTGPYNAIITPWSSITKFTDNQLNHLSGMPQMAYLGGYAAPLGSKIIVDARRKGSGIILSTGVVAWVSIRPVITDIYTANELNLFLNRLTRPWDKARKVATGLPKKLIAEASDNNLIFCLSSEIFKKEQLEFELVKNDEIKIPWKPNDFDNDFVWLTNLKPGEYVLKMRYTAQRQHVTEYPFQLKTPWYQSGRFFAVVGFLITIFFAFMISLLANIRQKRKAKNELSKKTKLQLELKAIYAQLNPHFIFNALSSIQGLINQQDIKGANSYLSDFAGLLRESLNNSNKEQVALKQEVAALETYLKLEQLRFGFKHTITVADDINMYETEIPSLLLQPLVENAVKHGVSALQDQGIISVNFKREQNDLLVTVSDNGTGFAPAENTTGFGLKLTRDRIKLLNDFANGQTISLEMKKNVPAGTMAALIFKNWFL